MNVNICMLFTCVGVVCKHLYIPDHVFHCVHSNKSDVQAEGRCVPFIPAHMVHTSSQTAEYFSQLYDRHGDSYTEPVTEESLATIFQTITENVSHVTTM